MTASLHQTCHYGSQTPPLSHHSHHCIWLLLTAVLKSNDKLPVWFFFSNSYYTYYIYVPVCTFWCLRICVCVCMFMRVTLGFQRGFENHQGKLVIRGICGNKDVVGAPIEYLSLFQRPILKLCGLRGFADILLRWNDWHKDSRHFCWWRQRYMI